MAFTNGNKDSLDLEITDRFYGKEFIRFAQVERNGAFHTVKEYEMELKTSLADVKEYMSADNSELVCAEACKDAIYILANNHGIKSPEEFGILVSTHLLATYSQMMNVCLTIDDFTWNRISYDAEAADGDEKLKLHNHAFIHTPECVRTCSVTLNRKDMTPHVVSGIKNLRLLKSSQATFAGFYRNEYTTLTDNYERLLSTNVSCTWRYKDDVTNIDYDDVWKTAKGCIIKSWGGDLVDGVLSTCVQFTLQSAEKSIFKAVPEISSIEMMMPNLLYADFDFTKFKNVTVDVAESRKLYVRLPKPSGIVFAKMVRNRDC